MDQLLPRFKALYVVSDTHIGGRKDQSRNFQIFRRGARLAQLIRSFVGEDADVKPADEVCLVLNGDFIDTLAEDELAGKYVALEANTALGILDHLYTDPAFAPVWDALADFVSEGGHLTITLGNHDLELTLPIVQRSIRSRLNSSASQVEFAISGGGYACQVGEAVVFCSHGNELDDWNSVDYTQLGWLANATNAGRAVDPTLWQPNAGTKLVVDVMNRVKREHPFVDLLKPETEAVPAVLMTIEDEILRRVDWSKAIPIFTKKIRRGLVNRRILSESDDLSVASTEMIAEEAALQLLGPNLAAGVAARRTERESEDDLLLAAADPTAAPPASAQDQRTLGLWDIAKANLGWLSPAEGLRLALKDWLADDQTFNPRNVDDALYKGMRDRVAPGVSFVVTGHTHSAQSLPLPNNRRYFNSGTWVRLLRLTPQVLDDPTHFEEKAFQALSAGSMEVLDKALVRAFGGKPQYEAALKELEKALYSDAA